MASRAIIEEIIDERRARVRIPTYDGSEDSSICTPFDELSIATIASPNGMTTNYKRGDVVFVEFEDNDIGKPIVIGNIQTGVNTSYNADMSSDALDINKVASLPKDTSIGDVSGTEISHLQGLNQNVQEVFSNISGIYYTTKEISGDIGNTGVQYVGTIHTYTNGKKEVTLILTSPVGYGALGELNYLPSLATHQTYPELSQYVFKRELNFDIGDIISDNSLSYLDLESLSCTLVSPQDATNIPSNFIQETLTSFTSQYTMDNRNSQTLFMRLLCSSYSDAREEPTQYGYYGFKIVMKFTRYAT